jgi:hypothetical protein
MMDDAFDAVEEDGVEEEAQEEVDKVLEEVLRGLFQCLFVVLPSGKLREAPTARAGGLEVVLFARCRIFNVLGCRGC